MDDKNIKVTKEIKVNTMSFLHANLITHVSDFSDKLLITTSMPILSEKREVKSSSLIFDMTSTNRLDQDTLKNIVDLLTQLKDSQADPNVFVQNNTVVKQQILSQLKNELINVQNKLSKGQQQKLEIISNDSFDEDTLNDLLKSLKEDSKKKLKHRLGTRSLRLTSNDVEKVTISHNVLRNQTQFIRLWNRYEKYISKEPKIDLFKESPRQKSIVHVKKLQTAYDKNNLYNLKLVQSKSILNKVINKEKTLLELLQPIKETNSFYKESETKRKYGEIATSSVEYKDKNTIVYNKDFNYLVYKDIEERYSSNIEQHINKIISTKTKKESQFIHYGKIDKYKEDKLYLKSRDLYVKDIRFHVKSILNKDILQHEFTRKNILDNKYIKNNILKINNDVNYRYTQSITKDNFLDTSNLTYYNEDIKKTIEDHQTKIRVINNRLSILDHEYINKKDITNFINLQSINKEYSKKYENLLTRHIIEKSSIFDQTLFSAQKNKITLYNSVLKNNFKINNIEDIIKNTTKNIILSQVTTKINSKTHNVYEDTKIKKRSKKLYNTVLNKSYKTSLNIIENQEENKVFDKVYLEDKNLSINRYLKNKESQFITSFKSKREDVKTENYNKIIKRINNIKQDNKLISNFYNEILDEQKKDVYNEINKIYHSSFIKKIVDLESIVNKFNFEKNRTVKKTNKHQFISKNIITDNYKEAFNDEEIYKTQNVILKKIERSPQKIVESKIRQISEDIISRTLNIIDPERIRRTIIDEDKISNILHYEEKKVKSTFTIRDTLKDTNDISKNISRKLWVSLSPDIRGSKTKKIIEKNIYREIRENKKLYFNDIQESIGEKVLLKDRNIVSENIVEKKDSNKFIIYKAPININRMKERDRPDSINSKTIYKDDIPEVKEERSQPRAKFNKFSTQADKTPKILKEDDVIKIIDSYIGDIDIDSISDIVMERVEEEMESQKRRSGII